MATIPADSDFEEMLRTDSEQAALQMLFFRVELLAFLFGDCSGRGGICGRVPQPESALWRNNFMLRVSP